MEKPNNYNENEFGIPDEWEKTYKKAYLEALREIIEEKFLGTKSYQAIYEGTEQQLDETMRLEAKRIHKKLMEFDNIEDLLNFAKNTLIIELTSEDENILNQTALEITKDVSDGKHNF